MAETGDKAGSATATRRDGDWKIEVAFTKLSDERQIAAGWAYTMDVGGALAVDHSGDFIDKAAQQDLEDAVHLYVLESREADEMHKTFEGIAKLVGSVVITEDKAEAMGITTDRHGWWVEFKIQDADVWEKIKDGTYPSFSIRGTGTREEV